MTRSAAVLVVTLVACGGVDKHRALRDAHMMLDAASTGFAEWDRLTQDRIAREAPVDQARGDLEAYRARRDPVVLAFVAAWAALGAAAADPGLPQMIAVATALRDVWRLVQAFRAGETTRGTP